MPLAEDQNMIQAFAPKRSDQPFSIWILPGRPRRCWPIANPHRPKPTREGLPVCAIIVAHQIGRRRVPRERLYDLLGQPLRGRIPGYRKPQQLSPSMAKHKKSKQVLEGQGWDHAEINRRDGLRVTAQECPPGLRWRSSASDHVLGDRRLGDLEPKLQQFAMNSRSAPQWILLAHPPDEIAQLTLDSGPSGPSSRFPAPVGPKSRSMPPQDRGRLNNSGQTEQVRPHSGHPNHQGTVTCPKPDTLRGSPQGHVELMTQKEVLDFKPAP